MSPLDGIRHFLASHTEMSTSSNTPRAFPPVPPSLTVGDHELRDYSHDNSLPPTPPSTIPYYTPYLGLRARLSQVWLNRWTVLLFLVLVRLLLAITSINQNLAQAKEQALQACTSVEHIGSAMASAPHYMSTGVNALAADGVTKAVHGLMEMLMLSVTAVQEILLFIVNMFTATYVCLITLAIQGSLGAVIETIEKVGDFLNETIGDITGDLASTATTFENGLNSFLSGLKIPAILGGSGTPPQINIDNEITSLRNIKIDPTKMDADLEKLNASIPDFAQVQNFTNSVFRLPFELAKRAMNDSIANYTFDQSIFEVAPKQALSFCTDNPAINDFFDGLAKMILTARKISIALITLLAILVCIPMVYREIWRWRAMQQRSTLLTQNDAWDPLDVVYMAARPYTTTFGVRVGALMSSTKRQILTRWFVAYATSEAALFVLALGVAGLFECLCQYILLKIIEKEVPGLADEVGAFADHVVGALTNASTSWAVSANAVIGSTNADVNQNLFGWVNSTTEAVNGTLNTFVDEMSDALNATFGGTVLFKPVEGVINCLIGIKIAGIQKAITWVHDNAHVNFPQFRADVFSLGAAASVNGSDTDSFLASPGEAGADGITNTVIKVAQQLQESLRTEAIIAAVIVGLWFLNMLIGLIWALIQMYTRDKTRAEGGPVGYTGGDRAPVSPRVNSGNDETKFPQFGAPVSSLHQQHSNIEDRWAPGVVPNEKVGSAGHRSVEGSFEKGHERASSYGILDGKH